jgi:ADP-ribose pyrophosphatase YjhB (NUDIX family)
MERNIKYKNITLGIRGLVTSETGEVLFFRRRKEWKTDAPNKWDFVGRKIEFGEIPDKMIVREALKEARCDVKVTGILPKMLSKQWEFDESVTQQISACYLCKLVGVKPKIDEDDILELKWFKPSDLPKKEECTLESYDFLAEYLSIAPKVPEKKPFR